MSESVPRNAEQLPYARGLEALEHRIMTSGRPVDYDPNTMRFAEPKTLQSSDAVVRLVEVDVEDPLKPDMPLGYHAALFTDSGSRKFNLRAQISRPLDSNDVDQQRTVMYSFHTNGAVSESIVSNSFGEAIITDQRELLPPEVMELDEQLETLAKPNSQRTFPSILK